MKGTRKRGICTACGRQRIIRARGLCMGCYFRAGTDDPNPDYALAGGRWVNDRGIQRWEPTR